MAVKMRTGRQSTKIVDPKTGARVADPEFVGARTTHGGTGTSWPEVRKEYQSGKRSAQFNTRSTPPELKSYLTGKTNKLSEDFDEPEVSTSGDIRYTRTAKEAKLPVVDSKMMQKMPTKRATIQAPKGKLRQSMPTVEKPVFEAPAATRQKTKTSAAMTGGGKSGLTRATNPKGSLGAARVTTTVNKAGRGYNKEAKQFAAYANPTASGTYLNTASKPEIMRMRAESKGIQKQYRKEGNKEGVQMMRSEAKQLKTAGKFADKLYEKGGGKYFKGSMVDQYRKSR